MTTPRRSLPPLACALLLASNASAAKLDDKAFVDSFVPVDAVIADIGRMLPELPDPGAAFLREDVDAELLVQTASTVQVTFVGETSTWRNTLGVFTWDGADPATIVDRQLVFPDASDDVLDPGETVTLRDGSGYVRLFPAGTHLGFFLVADGKKKSKEVKGWDAPGATIPSANAADNAGVGRGLCTTVDALNPETAAGRADVARRAALFSTPSLLGDSVPTFVLGFEAQDRTDPHGDGDFNDVVVLVRGAGLVASGALVLDDAAGDDDGDGVPAASDAFPNDPERAQVRRVPSQGFALLALDHGYPEDGDGDFDDAVLAWAFDVVTDADGGVKELLGHFHLLARSLDGSDRFGLHLPGLPPGATGDVRVERFLGDDDGTHELEALLTVEDVVSDGNRIEILLDDTAAALPAADSEFGVNTGKAVERSAASVRMLVTFDDPVDAEALGAMPFDPYWMVETGVGEADVHEAGVAGFLSRPPGLPSEDGEDAFLSDSGWPWSLALPAGSRFALEGVPASKVYPWLIPWAASHGQTKSGWTGKMKSKQASLPSAAYLENRPWTIGLPAP
ncbi:MAG: LruC domain-containing protein [Planctomycetes bacterium]|nr:LruC domain-containing protein [Planctomycetota bacterium]